MSELIKQFATYLDGIQGLQMERAGAELLVRFPVDHHRMQTVKVAHLSIQGKYDIIKFHSRAAVAKDHNWIKIALKLNGSSELISLILDTQEKQYVIDATYSVIANWAEMDGGVLNELLLPLQRIATIADKIEKLGGGQDNF